MFEATQTRTGRSLAVLVLASLVATGPVEAKAQGLDAQLRPVVDKVIVGARAAGAKRLTVADFTDLQGQVTELGRFIAEELASNLVEATPPFGVVDRANLRSILAEHKLNMSGLVNPETAKKLGQIAGVDGIVTGTITPLGDSVRLSVKVIATETATVMAAARAEVPRTKAIEELLSRSVESVGGGGGGSASGSSGGSTASVSQSVFENQMVRLTVRSLKATQNGDVLMSTRLDSRIEGAVELGCGEFDLVDEDGERWHPYSQSGPFGMFRSATLEPGIGSLASVTFRRPSNSKVAAKTLDLSGVCEVTVQGRRTSFPVTLTGLRAQ